MKIINDSLTKNGEKIFIPSKSDFNKIKMLRIVIDIVRITIPNKTD